MTIAADDPFIHMDPFQSSGSPVTTILPNITLPSSRLQDGRTNAQVSKSQSDDESEPRAESTPVRPITPKPNHRIRCKQKKKLSPLPSAAQEASESLLRRLQNRRRRASPPTYSYNSDDNTADENTDDDNNAFTGTNKCNITEENNLVRNNDGSGSDADRQKQPSGMDKHPSTHEPIPFQQVTNAQNISRSEVSWENYNDDDDFEPVPRRTPPTAPTATQIIRKSPLT